MAEIIARERGVGVKAVGRRPWPASSLLPTRWLSANQREDIRNMVPDFTS